MSWISFCVLALAATALLMVPGTIVNRCARLSWHTSLGLAPAVSTVIIAISAIIADRLGLAWNLLAPMGLTVVCSIAALLVAHFARRHETAVGSAPARRAATTGPSMWWWVIGGTLGVALTAWHMLRMLGRPDNFSQTYDNIFHLNVIRWILDNSNGSSLTNTMTSGDLPPSFYPMAWHDIASLALKLVGSTDVAAAANAMVVVVPSVVWVLGCFYLLRVLGRLNAPAIIIAGLLVAAFPSFPYLPSYWGVLYPNVLGLALIPSVVAFSYELLDMGRNRVRLSTGIPIALAAILGMALAHPNTIALYAVMLIPLLATWAVRVLRTAHGSRSTWLRVGAVVLFAAALTVVVIIWKFIRPAEAAASWPPTLGWRRALWQAATLAPLTGEITILPASILVAIGALVVIVTRRHVWLLVSHLALVFLWLVVSCFPWSSFRSALVGVWYNDATRLAAALPLTALPLGVIGVSAITSWLIKWLTRTTESGARYTRPVTLGVTCALTVLLFPLTQLNPVLSKALDDGAATYRVVPHANVVDTDEYALIQRLPELIPDNERVATAPYNGSSMAYALENIQTTTTHVLYSPTEEVGVINQGLNSAASNPAVCQALSELNVTYALDFGNLEVNRSQYSKDSPGFAGLDQAPGFTPVASSGHAVLYRIDACG